MNECLLALCLALGPGGTAAGMPQVPILPEARLEAPGGRAVAEADASVGAARGAGEARAPEPVPDRLFGEDKFKHFVASFFFTSVAASGARAAGLERDASLWTGAGVGVGLGLLKEVRDLTDPVGDASLLDVAWDLAGAGLGTAAAAQAW